MGYEGVISLKLLMKLVGIILVVFLAFMLWVHNDSEHFVEWKNFFSTSKEDTSGIVSVTRQDGTIVKLPLETYLEGVIGSEMPASYNVEALKAQCIAARTFVMQRGMQVDDTTKTQVYHDEAQQRQIWGDSYSMYHEKIQKALEDTKGQVLTYDGKLISAVFFSSSCGKTANSEEYWNSETPYLRSVDSSWDKDMPGYEKTVSFTADEFRSLLGFQKAVSEISEPEYYSSGYVKSITIDRITFTGREVREKLNLRSSSFSIKKQDNSYVMTTKGYGHGLGMSQEGAQAMAEQGKSYEEILTHYYTGVKIEKKDV